MDTALAVGYSHSDSNHSFPRAWMHLSGKVNAPKAGLAGEEICNCIRSPSEVWESSHSIKSVSSRLVCRDCVVL